MELGWELISPPAEAADGADATDTAAADLVLAGAPEPAPTPLISEAELDPALEAALATAFDHGLDLEAAALAAALEVGGALHEVADDAPGAATNAPIVTPFHNDEVAALATHLGANVIIADVIEGEDCFWVGGSGV